MQGVMPSEVRSYIEANFGNMLTDVSLQRREFNLTAVNVDALRYDTWHVPG